MPTDLFSALRAVADRLVFLASKDAELRSQLQRLAQAVLEATTSPELEFSTSTPTEPKVVMSVDDESLSIAGDSGLIGSLEPATPLRAIDLPELTLGRSAPSVVPAVPSYPLSGISADDADLSITESRCRLKAEGARWAATRRRLIAEGTSFSTEIDPLDRDIIARAKAIPDCFLWMCHVSGPSPSDLTLFENVAGCFEAVADVVATLKQILDEPSLYQTEFEQLLDLLAEAQSALRVAISAIDGPSDSDQVRIFNWLKTITGDNQILIQRHMRADDPADPSQWADLCSRIEAVDSALQETRRQAKQRRKLLGKVRHKLSLIADGRENADEHWRLLTSTVNELVNDGMPPSNRELRELLVPMIDRIPDFPEVPKGFQLVLRELDRFMATCPLPETTSVTQSMAEVEAVANLLRGRSMILIGGDRRPGSDQALKDAFEPHDLTWIETREHQSIEGFEPYIARPDVAVVVLAIRWSSHSFGDVRQFCDRHGKPLVRLPGGYNRNQVAAQIMAQCSDRLRAEQRRLPVAHVELA